MGMKKRIIVAVCVCIVVAFATAFGVALKRISDNKKTENNVDGAVTENSSFSENDSDSNDVPPNTPPSDLTSDDESDHSGSEPQDSAEDSTDTAPQDSVSESDSTDSAPAQDTIQPPPEGFFSDALFIGDSRTVGLRDYGGIQGAIFFADSGMSVYNIKNKSINVTGVGNTNLEALISGGKYQKIYIMLGINELGYPDMDKAVAKYGELIDMLKSAQPDAAIIIEANLHVAEETSSTHQYFTNSNINTLNEKLSKFADNTRVFYIDVNPLFDDGEGNLDKQYTYNDDFHLSGKYYKTWADWIATQP